MPIRKQKTGPQKKWTLGDIKEGFEFFYKEHTRYPTATELDLFEYLPSGRTIQRRFGGIVSIRKELGLSGQEDFTKGEHSTLRAQKINKRAQNVEKEVYNFLVGRFNIEFVHREFFFSDDKRTRTDFFVYTNNGNFSVDIFYPADKHNFIGCLNSKMRTYSQDIMLQYPVIFLQMNKDINQEEIEKIIDNKKNKLRTHQKVMGYNKFKKFCLSKVPKKT